MKMDVEVGSEPEGSSTGVEGLAQGFTSQGSAESARSERAQSLRTLHTGR